MKKLSLVSLFLNLLFIFTGCLAITPIRESLEYNEEFIPGVQTIFTERVRVKTNLGKLRLVGINMISQKEAILHYGRISTYDSETDKYSEDALYICNFNNGKLTMVEGNEKKELTENISYYENYRWIPPTTGQFVGELFSAALGNSNQESTVAVEIATVNRDKYLPIRLIKHTWEEKKYDTQVYCREEFLEYERNGQKSKVLLIPEAQVVSTYFPESNHKNAKLTNDMRFLFIGNKIVNLVKEEVHVLIDDYRVLNLAVDDSWSKLAVLYQDDNRDHYIGLTEIVIQ